MTSLKKNFLYRVILTTANYIFPLLVYPYVSRILGVEYIGLCNFIDSVINYFVLFSLMGINIMGIREIAAVKKDPGKLNSTFSSLLALNAISTLVMLGILVLCTIFVPELRENKSLMVIGGIRLASNLFLIEWLYSGLEEFKFITIRTMIVKCIYVASVFLFVHNQSEYTVYYFINSVVLVSLNALINIFFSRKYVSFGLKGIAIKPYLKGFFSLGLYMVLTSMYTSFNVTFLGFSSDSTQVGYYTTASKLYTIILSVFTALTTVIMPRMSALLSEGKTDEFHALLKKSYSILFGLTIPMVIVTTIFAPQIIWAISGPGYEGAIIPMRIIMPLMVIIGYEQILVIQTLMPLKKDKAILVNSICGAALGVTLNIILVPKLQAIGSSIVWVCSEFLILVLSQVAVKAAIGTKFPYQVFFKNLWPYIPLAAVLTYIYFAVSSYMLQFIIVGIILGIYIIVVHTMILKTDIFKNLLEKIKIR